MKSSIRKNGMMHHQRGATLIVVLIMLLLVTMLGVWGIRTAMTS